MEGESAVIMLKRCEEKNIDIVGLTTDKDSSSTRAKCAKEVPSKKKKRKTDLNRCKKSICML